jgi:ribosomal protein S27AE
MSFTNKSILCPDCGTTFNFTVGEQEFFASKGLINDPKRCPRCRQARKRLLNDPHGGYSNTRFS